MMNNQPSAKEYDSRFDGPANPTTTDHFLYWTTLALFGSWVIGAIALLIVILLLRPSVHSVIPWASGIFICCILSYVFNAICERRNILIVD